MLYNATLLLKIALTYCIEHQQNASIYKVDLFALQIRTPENYSQFLYNQLHKSVV